MEVFDKLPKHVREKLANANHNWCPEETRQVLFWEGTAYVNDCITGADHDAAAAHYAILASGKPYPRETEK